MYDYNQNGTLQCKVDFIDQGVVDFTKIYSIPKKDHQELLNILTGQITFYEIFESIVKEEGLNLTERPFKTLCYMAPGYPASLTRASESRQIFISTKKFITHEVKKKIEECVSKHEDLESLSFKY